MRIRNRVKKGIAVLLSSVLTFGMAAGIIPGSTLRAQAANVSISEPSITFYATKDQLMDGTFAPNADGTANNVGKLVFGKNRSGEAQKWYILGKDNGVSGDNTAIFAAEPIATDVKFNSSAIEKTYIYENEQKTVYANHYGASALRKTLQDIAGNTDYFSKKEQSLMQKTEVKTMDTYNNNVYATSDKLYALGGDSSQSVKIWAGSNDDKRLDLKTYFNSENVIWLRTPLKNEAGSSTKHEYAYTAASGSGYGQHVYETHITVKNDVRPASNLNLSKVLFASGADMTGKTMTKDMILRLDGSEKNIGSVTYNASTGKIKAVKGNTANKVLLVVQYKYAGQERAWFEDKFNDSKLEVTISDIKKTAKISDSVGFDLSKCKIWLEMTDSDGMVYAVEAIEKQNVPITSVDLTEITAPISGNVLDTSAICMTQGVETTTPVVTWTPEDTYAGYNKAYQASVTLTAADDYGFSSATTATVNGNSAKTELQSDGTLKVTYTFPATSKDKLTGIIAPASITVANGTLYENMNLPNLVNIETIAHTVAQAVVSWDTVSPVSGSYNPTITTEQTVTLKGSVICPEAIDANGVDLSTSITITISAAGITGAPIASVESGTYTENRTVELKSSTEGATIYYTTDGSDPGVEKGIVYTTPISVTGTEGQSVTTTIKAIAVKDGMQNSEAKTFTYTIEIPEIIVPPSVEKPMITSQPQNVSVKVGEQATFAVTASGEGITYQWQIDRNDGNGFVDITGANSANYLSSTVDKDCNGFKYQCVISNAGGSVTTEIVTLTVTENTTPQPTPEPTPEPAPKPTTVPAQYKIIDGANSQWTQNTDGSLVIRGDGEMSKFQNVKVDGVIVDAKNYTVTEGSTIITFTSDYLKTLSAGSHTFEMFWTDGSASTNFAVVKNTTVESPKETIDNNSNISNNNAKTNVTDAKNDNQNVTATQTGDPMNLTLWMVILMVSLAGCTGMIVRRKKHYK